MYRWEVKGQWGGWGVSISCDPLKDVDLFYETTVRICMFTQQTWLVVHAEDAQRHFCAETTLIHHRSWSHAGKLSLNTHDVHLSSLSVRAPFLLRPSLLEWHHFFHTLQMGRAWVRVWCRLIDGWREIGFGFCLFRLGGGACWWCGGLAGLGVWFLNGGVCVFLKWPVSSMNRQIRAAGDSKLPLVRV